MGALIINMPPPPPVPIDGVPQFDSFEFKGKLYSKIVHIPSPPTYVGYDPKEGASLPLPPGTPVVHMPSPGFGLILLIALGLVVGVVAALVIADILTQEEADAVEKEIDDALADPSKFTNPEQHIDTKRPPRRTSTTAEATGRRRSASTGTATTRPIVTEDIVVDEPVLDPERTRVRVGRFGSGFEEE